MKFEAEKLDMDLELITIDGEEINLKPKIKINTTNIKRIITEWSKIEEQVKEDRGKSIDLIAKELSLVYEKPPQWWMDNFDLGTLSRILTYVANTMGGLKKSTVNSS